MAPKPSQGFNPARRGALEILGKVFDRKAFASEQIDATLRRRRLKPEDRGLLTQLVYGVLRHHGTLEALLKKWIRSQTPKWVRRALELGLYQLIFLEKIPDHAVLHETVEGVKRRGGASLGAMANAVLRKAQGDREKIRLEIDRGRWVSRDFPPWLWRRWVKRYGEEKALALGKRFNRTPVLWARVSSGIPPHQFKLPLHPASLPFVKISAAPFEKVRGWVRAGQLSIQDPGSYEIVRQLDPQSREAGLDACAGHGGKTAVIAQWLGEGGYELWAYDISVDKIQALKQNFKRLGLRIPRLLNHDSLERGGPWDWILLDAPCSGLGTLGRKPELRWKTPEADLLRHQKVQRDLLKDWAQRVKVGGRILYAVCSLEPEEGPQVVEAFLKGHPAWRSDGQGVFRPGEIGEDGFFWARIIFSKS